MESVSRVDMGKMKKDFSKMIDKHETSPFLSPRVLIIPVFKLLPLNQLLQPLLLSEFIDWLHFRFKCTLIRRIAFLLLSTHFQESRNEAEECLEAHD